MPESEQHRNTCCPWLKIPHKEQEMNTSWVTSSGDGLGLGTCTWTSKVTDLSVCLGCPNLVSSKRQAGKAGHPPDHLGPTGATQEEEADGGELPQRAEPSPPTAPAQPLLYGHISGEVVAKAGLVSNSRS